MGKIPTLACEGRKWSLPNGKIVDVQSLIVLHNGQEVDSLPYKASDEDFAKVQKEWADWIEEAGVEVVLTETKRRFAIGRIFMDMELAVSYAASLMAVAARCPL